MYLVRVSRDIPLGERDDRQESLKVDTWCCRQGLHGAWSNDGCYRLVVGKVCTACGEWMDESSRLSVRGIGRKRAGTAVVPGDPRTLRRTTGARSRRCVASVDGVTPGNVRG